MKIITLLTLPQVHAIPYMAINLVIAYIVFTAIILKVFRFVRDKNMD